MIRPFVFLFVSSLLVLHLEATSGFVTPTSTRLTRTTYIQLHLAKGKGFGTEPSAPIRPKKESLNEESEKTAENPFAAVNSGQQALEQMRRERAEQRDSELRQVKELRMQDDIVREEAGAAVIPEKVAQRMGKRMLPFVGIPLFGGMGAFVAFWYLATYKNMEFQPVTVAATTIAILVFGLLGITYSMMSASWDPEREGSAMGTDEFGRNLGNLKDGFSRSRENAILRDKMAGMSEQEIQGALRELDKRDEKKRKQAEGRLEELKEITSNEDP